MTEFSINDGLEVRGTTEKERLEVEPEVGEAFGVGGGVGGRDGSQERGKFRAGGGVRAGGSTPGAEVSSGEDFVGSSRGVGGGGTIVFGV